MTGVIGMLATGGNAAAPASMQPTTAGASPTGSALALRGVRKSFGAVVALKGVDLTAAPGEVHAVVGENGAGKSTLIAIAAGILRPSTGEIAVGGVVVAHPTPRLMLESGIGVAFQHPALVPDLTVYENIQLAYPALRGREGIRQVNELLTRVTTDRLRVDSRVRVETLPLAQRHVVEIARALAGSPRVLILDEPTEPFQEPEVQHLFALVRTLQAQGVAIIYVSHRLHEVQQIATTISILRDGALIDTRPRDGFSPRQIVDLIAGRPIESMFPRKSGQAGGHPRVLDVAGLSGPGFRDVSVSVALGEIVGFAGVEGQGQREFLRTLAGLERPARGKVTIGGRVRASETPAQARAAGIGFVPDDRHAEGLFLPLSVRENLVQTLFDSVIRFGFLSRRAEIAETQAVAERMRIKTPSLETGVSSLSGGNQQKILIGREMAARPRLLVIDEPTKGVDVGSKAEIYQMLRTLAASGVPVLISSSDGVELEGLCDRVLIFARGSVVAELSGANVTDLRITETNLGAKTLREHDSAGMGRSSRLRSILSGDHVPAMVLAGLLALLVLGTGLITPDFLSPTNIGDMLTLLSALTFLALGQFCVMVTGGIDLSIGPFAGLVVVVASFLLPEDQSMLGMVANCAGIVAFGAIFGLMQGWVIERLRVPAIVVTLATFIGLQGVSLLLRPTPAGTIGDGLSDLTQQTVLGIPLAMLAAIVVTIGLEVILISSGYGRMLRGVGSNALASERLGVAASTVRVAAFGLCSGLAGLGGLVLAGKVGIGSSSIGVNYTLTSITAVVLGGASVVGGRGSFVSTLMGAILIEVLLNATTFLQVNSAWQYWLTGGATLGAACVFTLCRERRRPA